ncbi:cyclin-D5-1-like [Euphorbia lathyris]|uniref:cyclin-D5-1-like n=1 Tax=Euphorbia lathyris TaxID=212925 RepID=UPI0033144369
MEDDAISELLYCDENLEDVVEDKQTLFNIDSVTEEEEVFVGNMMNKEINFNFKNLSSDNRIRSEAVSWIFQSRKFLGFGLQTIYVSIAYFDQFLSRRSIQDEKLGADRLVRVACLSLAAKMEEMEVPLLTQYHLQDYNIETKVIQRMELLILQTLEWRMILTTPFHFLHYFIIKFSNNNSSSISHLESTTVGFIMALIKEINFMSYRPSVIAAAATLMALDESLTRKALEGIINSISSSGLLQTEDVFECYNVIKKLKSDDLETSSVTCATNGRKRKRLEFNNV